MLIHPRNSEESNDREIGGVRVWVRVGLGLGVDVGVGADVGE